MSIAAFQIPTSKSGEPKKISWEVFQRRYLDKEDRFKYEWKDGELIKTQRTMNQSQQIIFISLTKLLRELSISSATLGELLPEVETWFGPAWRRPDIAYFSLDQIQKFKVEENQVPQFVVEVISNNDQLNKANEKLIDYRNAKVPIVWFVYPKTREVHVYRGKQMTICTGDDICSAEPVIPGFLIPASKVFE